MFILTGIHPHTA